MKRLILMRHAKTEPWNEGIDDHGRALLPRGFEDARAIAEDIVAHGRSPELILVSTARRARETCSEVCKIVEDERVRPMESLYLTGVRGLSDTVMAHDGGETLMIIGHNPGLHDFALSIFREGGSSDHYAARMLAEKFPTACAAIFEAEESGAFIPAHFRLVDVLRPKDIRKKTAPQ